MSEYLLSIYVPGDGQPPEPDELAAIMRDVHAVRQEMQDAGAWVFSAGLHDTSTATVINPRIEGMGMTDGPFTESKEHLGGLTIIRAENLDDALAWGRKLAGATTLPVEVRPFQDQD